MDNQDKIYEKIKNAAQKAEEKDFPGMDKIWSRVDEKLDNKVLVKKSKLWQKIAVAASILLLISVGYQFLKPEEKVITPKNEIVTADTIKIILPKIEDNKVIIVATETQNPLIKKEAEIILKKELVKPVKIVANFKTVSDSTKSNLTTIPSNIKRQDSEQKIKSSANTTNNSYRLKGRVFDALSVNNSQQEVSSAVAKKNVAKVVTPNNPPLMVLDGKVINNKKEVKSTEELISNNDPDEVESIVVLKEPLYIINGVEYSEEELFGVNPTSPYAPLNKQEIETVSILQEEKAVEIYGKKGKKGIVIITTKNKKPATTSQKSN